MPNPGTSAEWNDLYHYISGKKAVEAAEQPVTPLRIVSPPGYRNVANDAIAHRKAAILRAMDLGMDLTIDQAPGEGRPYYELDNKRISIPTLKEPLRDEDRDYDRKDKPWRSYFQWPYGQFVEDSLSHEVGHALIHHFRAHENPILRAFSNAHVNANELLPDLVAYNPNEQQLDAWRERSSQRLDREMAKDALLLLLGERSKMFMGPPRD